MSFPDLCTPIKTVLGFNKQNTRNNSNVDNSNVDNSNQEVILKEFTPLPNLHTSNDASILDNSPINNDTDNISQLSDEDLKNQLLKYEAKNLDEGNHAYPYFMKLIKESGNRNKTNTNKDLDKTPKQKLDDQIKEVRKQIHTIPTNNRDTNPEYIKLIKEYNILLDEITNIRRGGSSRKSRKSKKGRKRRKKSRKKSRRQIK